MNYVVDLIDLNILEKPVTCYSGDVFRIEQEYEREET